MINCTVIRARSKGGAKQKGQIVFAKTYMLGCLAAANFHMFQVLKCFSAAEYLHVTGLEGYQASPGPTGLEPQRGPPAQLLVCVY